MDPTQYLGLAGVPLIVALTEVIKRALQDDAGADRLPKQAVPLLSVVLGVALNVGLASYARAPLVPAVLLGVVAGLAAAGLYSGAKAVAGR